MDIVKMLDSFKKLLTLNLNAKTDVKGTGKNALKYLSWSEAWGEFVKVYPDATYEVIKNKDNLPYFADDSGAMVYVKVTANGLTHEMWLPVMDGANKAMKSKPYTYQVKEYVWSETQRKNVPTGNMVEKSVDSFTMFDINKTIMRCLTKCLAMFGLGLYIFNNEDMPEVLPEPIRTITQEQVLQLEELLKKLDSTFRERFLIAFEVTKIDEIPMIKFASAVKSLDKKIAELKALEK